ncbi:hypothetical protein Cfla_0405 [Cellulomonas flavigena DSM 20109]|uniref:Uncharacterized protein n=1 Tax=Cellulomonas flavigena (strain ATCC 482 / DSM 20109 / BCRC 11376 / JCM 18109 / NBRC 3775 / NCIMB 8073 / NRS 134) TaxID=446466 RepID=D5UHP8_CELFN|nr:hypothetical protein Cfla_0405 [Cellulomonas flavigena DSM 20109]
MSRTWRARTWRLGAAVTLVASVLGVGVSTAAEASAVCVPDQAVPDNTVKFDNCSGLAPTQLMALLNATDAAAEGNILNPDDRFFANTQWLGWIDVTTSPGVLRGLWPIDAAGNFTGALTDGHYRSVVYPYSGFLSPNSPRGYRGLHVEIWDRPEASGGHYWTYKNGAGPRVVNTPVLESGRIVRSYQATLWRADGATTDFVGRNGVTAQLTWSPSYSLTPTAFNITTTLGASADVNFTGDAGGMALLINPTCERPVQNGLYGGCPTQGVLDSGMHWFRTAVSATDLCGPVPAECATYTSSDKFVELNNGAIRPAALGPTNSSAYNLTASPAFNNTDPHLALNPQTSVFAYHFNYVPSPGSPLSGFGSLDLALRPADPARGQCLGPNRGQMQFGVDLTH